MRNLGRTAALATTILLVATLAPASAGGRHHDGDLRTVIGGLDAPRGLDALGHGKTLITESDGTFSLVIEHRHREAKQIELGPVPPGFGHAIAAGKHGKIYILTGAGGEPGGPRRLRARRRSSSGGTGTTSRSRCSTSGSTRRATSTPTTSRASPRTATRSAWPRCSDGSVLIADAAGNDLIRVAERRRRDRGPAQAAHGRGARRPSAACPPPEPMTAEAVATSVTVGPDGYWYVGELRGFPATPGTSQIWRIKPGSVGRDLRPGEPVARPLQAVRRRADLDRRPGASRMRIYAVVAVQAELAALERACPAPRSARCTGSAEAPPQGLDQGAGRGPADPARWGRRG